MSKESQDFTDLCRLAGIHLPGCGLAVRNILRELSQKALAVQKGYKGAKVMRGHKRMGVAVSHGFAVLHKALGVYEITQQGREWLEKVENLGKRKKARVLEANDLIHAVEQRCHGWRMLAGPFEVERGSGQYQREEQRLALKAKRDALAGGLAAKVVMYRGRAFVMRPAEGYIDRDTSKNAVAKAIKGEPLSVWEARKS
jgi:hypothetical protein